MLFSEFEKSRVILYKIESHYEQKLSVPNQYLVKTAPSSFYKGCAEVMAMGEPHDEQTPTRLPQREALFYIESQMLLFVVHLDGLLPMKQLNKNRWTGIQSANIYPNLIALSALGEKKDAKVRVDGSCFAV